ncbi:MazG-like family protein [Nonomuraea rubra]
MTTLTSHPTSTAASTRPHTPPSLWAHIAAMLTWLDAANPRTDHELSMRLMKIGEEYGEAVAAYIGLTGQNPRKGVTHTHDDLAGELCDIVITALVALASHTGTAATAEATMRRHLERRAPPPGRPHRHAHRPLTTRKHPAASAIAAKHPPRPPTCPTTTEGRHLPA